MAVGAGLAAFFATELGKEVGKAALDIGVDAVNNRIAKKNAKEQREWQEDMWYKQNAYNSPVMMAFRMRQAGLNPYAMTGAEPAGSAGTGASAESHPYRSPLDSIAQAASISNLNADTQKKREEAEAARLNNMNLAVDVNNKAEYVRLYLLKYEEEIGLTKAQRQKYEAEAEEAFERARQLKEFGSTGGNVFKDTHDLTLAQIRNLDQAANLLEKQVARYDDMTDAQIEQLKSSALNLNSSANLAYENAKKASSETEALRYINESNELKAALRDFYGIDIDSIPLHLQYAAFNNYKAVKDGNVTPQSAYNGLLSLLKEYRKMSNTRVVTKGENVKLGPLGFGWSNAEIL